MYEYHTLPNGIRIVLSRVPSRVAWSGVYINVGSRDEAGADEGMAHFIEHSLFKGTTHRRSHHILNRIDGVGGELNAFTTKEETCIYATSLGEHLDRSLELFADVLFHSTFPPAEIAKERDVVLEEIDSYSDSPAELIFDDFEELAFEGHPLAHNILGSKRNVRRFTADRLQQHMQRLYTPSRMVITVVADVDMAHLVRICQCHFGAIPDRTSAVDRSLAPSFHRFERRIARHTHQTHLLIGCQAPDVYERDKTAFTLINNILGGPAMNSRLNVAVREHFGFCYNIESQYVPFSDTGLFYVYAGVDHGTADRTLDLVRRELHRLVDTPLSSAALRKAQRQFVGQMTINAAAGINEMQSIGKAYLCFDRVDTLEDMTADIMALTANDLQQVAARYLDSQAFSLLCYK